MFAEFIRRAGVPVYPLRLVDRAQSWLLGHVLPAHLGYIGVLVAEGVLDAFQREIMADRTVHPIARRICQIHVTEEARHLAYAEEELRRRFDRLPRALRRAAGVFGAQLAAQIERAIVRPEVYETLWPGRGRELAAMLHRSPDGPRVFQKAATRAMRVLEKMGVVDGWNRRLWSRLTMSAAG
jgi:hypothetical protein